MSDATIPSLIRNMDKYIVLDIETPYSFYVQDGIREVAAMAVVDSSIVEMLHLAIITDQEKYKDGYGAGLEAIEENDDYKSQFRGFINKYKYPLVAHYASFEKRFLSYWKWVTEDQPFYCSLSAIRRSNPGLPSYSLNYLLYKYGLNKEQDHTAFQDVIDLVEILKQIKPAIWAPTGSDYNPEYQRELTQERRRRLEAAKENPLSNLLNGKKVVFTGKMAGSRIEMMEIAIKHGAEAADSVSKKTDLLVVGEDAGSKLSKAIALNIKVISEKDFWKLVGQKSLESVR